jgi:hypothetical protein
MCWRADLNKLFNNVFKAFSFLKFRVVHFGSFWKKSLIFHMWQVKERMRKSGAWILSTYCKLYARDLQTTDFVWFLRFQIRWNLLNKTEWNIDFAQFNTLGEVTIQSFVQEMSSSVDLNGSSGSIADLKHKCSGFESQKRQGYICWLCGSKRSGCVINVGPCGFKVKGFALMFPKNLITN